MSDFITKYKMTIVEHDEDEFFFLQNGLGGHFDILSHVTNTNDLFVWLAENAGSLPDIILVEAYLPLMNGYEVVPIIRSNPTYSHIVLIVTSTLLPDGIIKNCLDLGARFYTKPDSLPKYKPFSETLHRLVKEKKEPVQMTQMDARTNVSLITPNGM